MLYSWFKLNRLIILLMSVFLFSCSNTATTMQVQPKLVNEQQQQFIKSDLTWSLSSQDQRIAHYLIAINKDEKPAILINEESSSRLIVQQTLHKEWSNQGLVFTDKSAYKLDIQLIKLLAEVQNFTFKHQINSNIVIRIQLSSEQKSFSKTFTSKFNSEGVLSANSEKVSEHLNAQLSELLNEIVHDSELNNKLQQF